MACISGSSFGEIFAKAMELGLMKNMGKIERAKGSGAKGGSTAERKAAASKDEKEMTNTGKRNETKKSDKANKVVGKYAKIK